MKCLQCGAEDVRRVANEALNPGRGIYQCRACQWVFIAAREAEPGESKPLDARTNTESDQ
jgi:hypothetical protein